MKLQRNDIVELCTGDLFCIQSIVTTPVIEYPVSGVCVESCSGYFTIDEMDSWTKEGLHHSSSPNTDLDILYVYTKQKNPEYFL